NVATFHLRIRKLTEACLGSCLAKRGSSSSKRFTRATNTVYSRCSSLRTDTILQRQFHLECALANFSNTRPDAPSVERNMLQRSVFVFDRAFRGGQSGFQVWRWTS